MSLTLRNLQMTHGRRAILRDVSMRFPSNAVSVIHGANGSGKSTLLGIIAGLVRPNSGEIEVDGIQLAGRRPDEIARLGVGYLTQSSGAPASLTVEENLSIALSAFLGWQKARISAGLALDEIGLSRASRIPFGRLSVGERRLICIQCCLWSERRLLLLDEPMTALNGSRRRWLERAVLARVHAGCTVVAVEHDSVVFGEIAHRFLLGHGDLVRLG